MANVIPEETSLIVCKFSNSGRGKVENTVYQSQYE